MEEAPARKVVLGREGRAGYAGAAVEIVWGGWSGDDKAGGRPAPCVLPFSYKGLRRQEGRAERQNGGP